MVSKSALSITESEAAAASSFDEVVADDLNSDGDAVDVAGAVVTDASAADADGAQVKDEENTERPRKISKTLIGNDYDQTQVALLKESIVVVDNYDKVIRAGSKKECHLNENISEGLLHRAFSVFLFDMQGRLLLQQRSDKKITFPLYWANTCCSHPLHTEAELELKDALGVKRAAVRKLGHELGIKPEQLPLDKFHFLTRIHYEAQEAGQWGEHEIDHVLVMQAKVDLEAEPNEVAQTRYFTEPELVVFLSGAQANGDKISPWFGHIQKQFLGKWWQALRDGTLDKCEDLEVIHRMGMTT